MTDVNSGREEESSSGWKGDVIGWGGKRNGDKGLVTKKSVCKTRVDRRGEKKRTKVVWELEEELQWLTTGTCSSHRRQSRGTC